jgi:S-methylmethionine-dependent homocysteine/selenocysteine methylase
VADEFGVRVAGCLPPPLGSYRPDLFEPGEATAILDVLIEAQAPFVDVWLAETLSSVAEAELAASLVRGSGVPVWLSFTVDDGDGSRLRSGEPVAEAVARAAAAGAEVVAFNCSTPAAIEAAVRAARGIDGVRLGAYANALEDAGGEGANAGLSKVRDDATPAAFCEWADRWIEAGATVVGGCCGIEAPHIAALAHHLSD